MNKCDQQLKIQYPGQPTYIFEGSMLFVEGKKYQLSSMSMIFDKNKYIKIYDESNCFQIYGQWNQLDQLFENLKKYCFQLHMKNHYEISKLVGQGSFGKVYQAIHKPSSKKYAIKQIDKEILNQSKSVIQLEIDILRRLDHETCIHIHEQCGTLGFIAPEILRGIPYDYKVDVFSLGVVLFVVLVGEYPFDDVDSNQQLQKNQQAKINFDQPQFKLLSGLGMDFLTKCLQANPKDRFSAKEAIKHPWLSKKSIDSRFIQQENKKSQILEIDYIHRQKIV
ncbi:hypothetical protein pb186bvf_007254 [Paramecium bursaria]